MTSIYDAIKADHDTHRTFLDAIMKTSGDSPERRENWNSFYEEVKSHAAAEEETFYSKLISETWGQDAARHSVHEHQKLDDLMEKLNTTDMSSPAWLLRFKTLKHDYEHHMEEEENEVFERAKSVIGEEENEGFAQRFETRKKQERELIDKKRADSLED